MHIWEELTVLCTAVVDIFAMLIRLLCEPRPLLVQQPSSLELISDLKAIQREKSFQTRSVYPSSMARAKHVFGLQYVRTERNKQEKAIHIISSFHVIENPLSFFANQQVQQYLLVGWNISSFWKLSEAFEVNGTRESIPGAELGESLLIKIESYLTKCAGIFPLQTGKISTFVYRVFIS